MDKTLAFNPSRFSARALAARLVPQGWRLSSATTRSADKATRLPPRV